MRPARGARGPRRRGAALALAAALVLAACGDGDPESGRTGEESVTEADPGTGVPGVSVAGAPGQPVVVIDTPLAVTDPVAAVVEEGVGRALVEGGPALLSVAAWDGTTGVSSGGGEEVAEQLVTVTEDEVGATLAEHLPGVREGSRLVVAEPVSVEGALTMQVVVVDVLPTVVGGPAGESSSESPSESPSESASGGEQAGEGWPTVGTTGDGAPVVGIPPGDPPEELLDRTVVAGRGASVLPGQQIVVQSLSMDWATGEVLSSTWADGSPVQVAVDDLAEGLRLAVLDRRVGSRILAVVPPALGDGTRTLVVVLDVLAATGGSDVVR